MESTKKFKSVKNDEPRTEEEKAIDAILEEADNSRDVFLLKLKKPFEWDGKTYEKLTFNWLRLTGRDSIEIEREMTLLGRGTATPEFTGEFQTRLACRACMEGLPYDGIMALPLPAYSAIQRNARNFMLGV